MVMDDEGAYRQTKPMEFKVEDHNLIVKAVGFIITPLGILLIGVFLVLMLMVAIQLRNKIGELPAPSEGEQEIPENNDEDAGENDLIDAGSTDEQSDMDPDRTAGEDVEETAEIEDIGMPDEIDYLPEPGLAPIPEPPDIDELEDFPAVGVDEV
jgi:hypothetical protein